VRAHGWLSQTGSRQAGTWAHDWPTGGHNGPTFLFLESHHLRSNPLCGEKQGGYWLSAGSSRANSVSASRVRWI